MRLLIAQAEIDGRRVDVRVRAQHILEMDERLRPTADEDVVDAHGAALLPGLHDHHIHLLATAAAAVSVQCGPPAVRDLPTLSAALRAARGEWVRGVGYVETVAGSLDRRRLDEIVADRPIRIQHRSGGLWVLNTAALQLTGLDRSDDPDVERDDNGDPTGRLWRFDARLRARLPDQGGADVARELSAVTARLLRFGITGVTDATPDLELTSIQLLSGVPLDLALLGAPDRASLADNMCIGPHKVLLRDHDLPGLDELVTVIGDVHARDRAVAVHCVTREALMLTVLALERVGSLPGDRIEHASVVPPEMTGRIAALGLAIVTQPSFITSRGDDYLRDVAAGDIDHLYPYASLRAHGVQVAPSSDAPYGDLDPWATIDAARTRRTSSGAVLAAAERVDAMTVLRGLLSPLADPGGPPRSLRPGARADLCLLDVPLRSMLAEPHADRVRLVLRGGVPAAELLGG